MIQEVAQTQGIDFHLIDPLDLNHLQFHDLVILIVFDILALKEN